MYDKRINKVIWNYVGNYSIKKINGYDVIISEEFHPAKDGEEKLKKKKINDYNIYGDYELLLALCKVDISSYEEILDFCNKYGLPWSSAINFDAYVDEVVERTEYDDTFRHDIMLILEFKRFALSAKGIYETIEIANGNIRYSCFEDQLSIFLSLILFDRINYFEDEHFHSLRYDSKKGIMTTPVMILQEFYLLVFKEKNYEFNHDITDTISLLIIAVEAMIEKDTGELTISEKDFLVLYLRFFKKLYFQLSRKKIQLTVDECGKVSLLKENKDNTFFVSEDLLSITKALAKYVIRDLINQNLKDIPMQLEFNEISNNTENNQKPIMYHLTISQSHLYQAIILELFNLLTDNGKLRKCANPTCNALFEYTNKRKIYCSHECGVLVAKRKQRKREKEAQAKDKAKNS